MKSILLLAAFVTMASFANAQPAHRVGHQHHRHQHREHGHRGHGHFTSMQRKQTHYQQAV